MGFSAPKPPEFPEPTPPGEAIMSTFFGEDAAVQGLGLASPEVQERILEAEATFGPEYVRNELARAQAGLFGIGGQDGLLALAQESAPISEQIRADTARSQRESDIADVEALGTRATDALRASDPARQELLENEQALVGSLFDRAFGVTPQQERMAQQGAREAASDRGRELDNAALFGEVLGREDIMRQNRAEALNASAGLFGRLQQTSADPFQAVLGRPAQALPMNQATGMQALGLQGTPSLFNPDAALNRAAVNDSNRANYAANVYGSQAAHRGSVLGGMFSGLGSLGGGLFQSGILGG